MFYPELKMPYMPISDAKAVTRGKTMESLEHAEAESAMVCFPLLSSTYAMPALECHVCLPLAQPLATKESDADKCFHHNKSILRPYSDYLKTIRAPY
jgi:hypothetical protein